MTFTQDRLIYQSTERVVFINFTTAPIGSYAVDSTIAEGTDMPLDHTRPQWLTFDCYGTLIQWDEGLQAAVAKVLEAHPGSTPRPSAAQFLHEYDDHEHRLERTLPYRNFADVTRESLRLTMAHFGLPYRPEDATMLTSSISRMPPFPEVVDTLAKLKQTSCTSAPARTWTSSRPGTSASDASGSTAALAASPCLTTALKLP